MPNRHHLPDTRASMIRKFSVGPFEFYLIVGFYENLQPGEIFITVSKQGSTFGGMMNAWAVTISLLLQYGVTWEKIQKKFEYMRFEPWDEKYTSPLDGVVKNGAEMISEFGGAPQFDYNGCPEEEVLDEVSTE